MTVAHPTTPEKNEYLSIKEVRLQLEGRPLLRIIKMNEEGSGLDAQNRN
jgi:hypothetical protein